MQTKLALKSQITESPLSVLNELRNILNDNNNGLINTVILLISNYKDIDKLRLNNTIDFESYTRNFNNIKLNILNVIDDLPDHYFDEEKNIEGLISISHEQNLVLIEINRLIKDLANISVDFHIHETNPKFQLISNQMITKRKVIANQIIKLSGLNKITLTSEDYNMVAEACRIASDNIKAEEHYKKAIDTFDIFVDTAFSKIHAIRCYARFLYNINREKEGAKMYEMALLEDDTDIGLIHNGFTFTMKFEDEIAMERYEEAIIAYGRAKDFYQNLKHIFSKKMNMNGLENNWNNRQIPSEHKRP